MKLIMIGPFPDPMNGCSYANEILHNGLRNRHFEIQRIDTSTENISNNHGGFSFNKVISIFLKYLQLFKIIRTDVVYSTPGQTFYGILKYSPFYLFCLLLNKPYVIHVHGNHLGLEYANMTGIRKRLFNFFISRASAGIVLSPTLRANFKGLLECDKVHVVYNFVSDDLINSSKKFLVKDVSKLKIVFLSNLMLEKGIFNFLNTLSNLKDEKVKFEARIAGNFEQESKEEVMAKMEVLGGDVQYLGLVKENEKIKLLEWANVFVLPTFYKMEGQPISILEGLAAGNIIISTDHAGIPDVISQKNGFLIKKKDDKELTKLLKEIDQNLCEYVDNFSHGNRTKAQKSFTENIFVDNVQKILTNV